MHLRSPEHATIPPPVAHMPVPLQVLAAVSVLPEQRVSEDYAVDIQENRHGE